MSLQQLIRLAFVKLESKVDDSIPFLPLQWQAN